MNTIKTRAGSAAIAQLRTEIEQLPMDLGGKRKGIPADLKRRASVALVRSGMRLEDFATAISISQSAMSSWRRKFGSDKIVIRRKKGVGEAGFKKLSITPEAVESVRGITIEGPNGLRVTGLRAEELAQLWRALC